MQKNAGIESVVCRFTKILSLFLVGLCVSACGDGGDGASPQDVAYHMLLSSWGIGDRGGQAEYSYGWNMADVDSANVRDSALALTQDCSLRIVSPLASALSSVMTECAAETEVAAMLSEDGLFLSLPQVVSGDDLIKPWDLELRPVGGDRTNGLPDFASGLTTVSTTLGSGAGERVEIVPAFLARKSSNASIASLVGNWGLVRVEDETYRDASAPHNLFIVGSLALAISTEDGGLVKSSSNFVDGEFEQPVDGRPTKKNHFSSESVDVSSPIAVASDGVVTLTLPPRRKQPAGESHQILEGFMTPDANLVIFAEGVPTIKQVREQDVTLGAGEDGFAAHQLNVFVRRNLEPELAGRAYRLVGTHYRMSSGKLELRSWNDDAELAFKANGVGVWARNESTFGVSLDAGSATGLRRESDNAEINFNYSVDEEGRIGLDLSNVPGVEDALVSGFSQIGDGLLVFMHAISYGDSSEGEIGLWFGYRI